MRRTIAAWPGSVLDDLRALAHTLAEQYGWQEAQATWFVLTGRTPLRWPVRARTNVNVRANGLRSSTITLTIEPWVPAAVVRRSYRQVQREALGQRNRPLRVRNSTLFRFVVERMDLRGRKLSWETLRLAWNRAYPHWQSPERRRFAKDFRRVEQALLFPEVR